MSQIETQNRLPVEVHGHRGARAIYPENTLSSFRYALAAGIDHIELDVHLSKDKQVVVAHDGRINRYCCLDPEGQKLTDCPALWELTLEEIKSYDCGSLKHPKTGFPQNLLPGERIPALAEVFELAKSEFPQLEVSWDVEIKYGERGPYPPRELLVSKVLDVIAAHDLQEQVVMYSFDIEIQQLVRKKAPQLKRNLLYGGRSMLGWLGEKLGWEVHYPRWQGIYETCLEMEVEVFSPDYRLLKYFPDWRRYFLNREQRPFQLIPWTVNDPGDWRLLAVDFDVDGIISDRPVELREFLHTLDR